MKLKIKTDIPIEWNRKTKKDELIFDKNGGKVQQTLL